MQFRDFREFIHKYLVMHDLYKEELSFLLLMTNNSVARKSKSFSHVSAWPILSTQEPGENWINVLILSSEDREWLWAESAVRGSFS